MAAKAAIGLKGLKRMAPLFFAYDRPCMLSAFSTKSLSRPTNIS